MRILSALLAPFALAALAACGSNGDANLDESGDAVSLAKKEVDTAAKDAKIDEVLVSVRAISLERKFTNGWLFAGIAKVETQLVHCYDYAGFKACPGAIPGLHGTQFLNSPDCENRPVVAGASDRGGCDQGGLGLFQLDSGSQTTTLSTWKAKGYDVLSVQGNTAAAIDLLIGKIEDAIRAKRLTDEPAAFLTAIASPNRSDADYELYLGILANGYNGWGWDSAGWRKQKTKYHEGMIAVLGLHDAAWWKKI